MLATLSLFALLYAPAAMPSAPGVLAHPGLTVRVSTDRGVLLDERTLTVICAAVRDIWRPYLEVTFVAAGNSREDGAGAAPRPGGRHDVRLVLTERTLGVTRGDALGWIEFVNGRPSQTITVSLAAVRRLMETSSWRDKPLTALPPAVRNTFVVRAIGHAVAHEIGHYLLESTGHSARGLMRDRFTADDIMVPRRVNDRLDRADQEKLRRGLVDVAKDTQPIEVSDPALLRRPPI